MNFLTVASFFLKVSISSAVGVAVHPPTTKPATWGILPPQVATISLGQGPHFQAFQVLSYGHVIGRLVQAVIPFIAGDKGFGFRPLDIVQCGQVVKMKDVALQIIWSRNQCSRPWVVG